MSTVRAVMMCPVCDEWAIDLKAELPLPAEGGFRFSVGPCIDGCVYKKEHAPAMMTALRTEAAKQALGVELPDGS